MDIPTNTACRAYDRVLETARSGDPNALRALLAPGLPAGSISAGQVARELLATAGDRIAVERVVAGGADSAAIHVVEVDQDGKLTALAVLEGEHYTAALLDAQERFDRGEGASSAGALFRAFSRAVTRRDWNELGALLTERCEVTDNRTNGLGRMTGQRWIDSLKARAELSADALPLTVRDLSWNRHGRVRVTNMTGTFPDGVRFESLYIGMVLCDDTRIDHMEYYDLDDVERALARFDQLCAARDKSA